MACGSPMSRQRISSLSVKQSISSWHTQTMGRAEGEQGVALLRSLLEDLPEELARQVFTHASWTERRSDSYARLRFLATACCSGRDRTSIHVWKPSALVPDD